MSVKYTSHKSEVLEATDQAIKRALEICGGTAERYAKDNIQKNRSVITGRLVNSIAHEPISDRTMSVGTRVEYAVFVERGHHQEPGRYVPAIKKRLKASFVPGKPYLVPAVEQHRGDYERIFKGELGSIG